MEFLTTFHNNFSILGEKQYNCHRCQFQCEMPNPLKIHLALECGKLTKPHLWKRLLLLENCVPPPTTQQPTHAAAFSLNPSTALQKRNSAFKPYKTVSKSEDLNKTEVKCQTEKLENGYSDLPNVLIRDKNVQQVNGTTFLYKQAVEMETIVSNLGRFKQGHLCIYCGKVYSRKYGLKIHIR